MVVSFSGLFGRGAVGLGFSGFLLAEPGAAGHFHAAFFIDADALGGDDIVLLDDVLDVFRAAFGQLGVTATDRNQTDP